MLVASETPRLRRYALRLSRNADWASDLVQEAVARADIDIWRAAVLMIKRYGAEADLQACLRADELSGEGNREGMRVWLRIMKAIDELQSVQPDETRH